MVNSRAALHGIEICEHGGVSRRSRGIIDFSVCLNPYGPPDFILASVKEATEEISMYPDSESTELKESIAKKFGCEEEKVLVGAGVSELIQLVALSFVKSRALTLEHTYGEYEVAVKMMDAKIKHIPMPRLIIHPELIIEDMEPEDVIFLCNPNNPTGQYIEKKEIEEIIEEAERVDALVVVDEAYVDFVKNAFPSHLLSSSHNLILLRSLTKSFAFPGVRLGYAISCIENIKEMRKVKVPWSVSVFAKKIGIAAVGKEGDNFLRWTKGRIERSKEEIENAFRDLDIHIHSDANFYILNVRNAKEVKNRLLREGILVRDCTSFGLPSYIRFSVKKEEENEMLIEALESCYNEGNGRI